MSPSWRDTYSVNKNCRGFGLIEIIAMIAIISILSAAGLMTVDQRRNDINTAERRILADFRWTRGRAIVSGVHHRINVTGPNNYRIERLTEGTGPWTFDRVVREVTLPAHVSLTSDEALTEFNTRGTIVFPTAAAAAIGTWTLNDSKFSAVRTLTIFPSGQINAG